MPGVSRCSHTHRKKELEGAAEAPGLDTYDTSPVHTLTHPKEKGTTKRIFYSVDYNIPLPRRVLSLALLSQSYPSSPTQ